MTPPSVQSLELPTKSPLYGDGSATAGIVDQTRGHLLGPMTALLGGESGFFGKIICNGRLVLAILGIGSGYGNINVADAAVAQLAQRRKEVHQVLDTVSPANDNSVTAISPAPEDTTVDHTVTVPVMPESLAQTPETSAITRIAA